jgi:hypothetical protein
MFSCMPRHVHDGWYGGRKCRVGMEKPIKILLLQHLSSTIFASGSQQILQTRVGLVFSSLSEGTLNDQTWQGS